jgi:hypothetical protein
VPRDCRVRLLGGGRVFGRGPTRRRALRGRLAAVEDCGDRVALGLRVTFDVRPDRLCALEHLRIGLAAFDPVLQGEADFFGDAAVVELGDDVQLRSQVIRDADRKGAHLTGGSRVLRVSGCLIHVSHLLILGAADEPGWFLLKPQGNEERTSNYAPIAQEFNLPIAKLCCENYDVVESSLNGTRSK